MTKETPQNVCHDCGEVGRIVTRQTVVHHVKSEKLVEVKSDDDAHLTLVLTPECKINL
jgi:hypothetical protein